MKKYFKRAAAVFTAVLMALNMASVAARADEVSEAAPEVLEQSVETPAPEESHAYDPIGDLEAEQEYRESVNYEENKIVFSVIDYRVEGSRRFYLNDYCELAQNFGLKNVSYVFDSKTDKAEPIEGKTAYEVFYEAAVQTDDIWALVDSMNEDEGVFSAEPDFIWKNTGEGVQVEATEAEIACETHFPGLGVQDIWSDLCGNNVVPGKGVVVAVIDTGVDYNHFDLKANMWKNPGEIADNGIDDDGNGYVDDIYGYDFVENDADPMDDHGHGTHVSGIIAMTPGNGGGVGLAYGAKIMAIKAGQSTGFFASSDIAKAIKYAADNGADVINMSFGGTGKSSLVEAALADAFATTVLVAAAGNDGLPTTDYAKGPCEDIYPAGYNYVIGVMASDLNGRKAGFSNWDYIIGKNCEYEMAAPGVNIYSTLPNNRHALWSGTSMAAPQVAAAAAIIRSRYSDKSKYTSRYIMGQLVSATDRNVTFYDENTRTTHSYPALDIISSLNNQPNPNLTFNEFYMFDSENISETNNNDGVAQPGETIDLGLRIWNYWGAAKNVTITANAINSGGMDNPYVEFITDTINIGEVGSFATVSNGYAYTDGTLTGVSNPIRFRISDNAPNDVQIKINLTVTAENDMDDHDHNIYSSNDSYTFSVQNGVPLSGVIDHDMTLTADKYWIIENNVLIPEGVTVTVEPGTQIQFWTATPSNPYNTEPDVFIQVEGRFICEGTEDNPIQIFTDKFMEYGKDSVVICGNKRVKDNWAVGFYDENIIDDDYNSGFVELKYVSIMNASSLPGADGIRPFNATIIDHCQFLYNYDFSVNREEPRINARELSNSMFCSYHTPGGSDVDGFAAIYMRDNLICDSNIPICNSSYSVDHINEIFEGNVLLNNYLTSYQFYNQVTIYNYNKYLNRERSFKNNAILSALNLKQNTDLEKYFRNIGTVGGHDTYDISGNYWGTDNAQLVNAQIYDADVNVAYNDLVAEPFLTLNDDMSSIYPFVTEAYLTDGDDNRIDTVSGAQTVTMHVKFNRDMASDVQPMVTYGGAAPYTDYYVNGDWTSEREWTGEMTIDPFIDMGTMYIRVKDAAAADDKWLITGTDTARFFFNIEKSAAQSMALQGSGTSGSNELTWLQDDYDTLAGYNIYRSTSYDRNTNVSEQSFTKVNTSLISADELAFSDTNVEQGVDYYYYFTVVDTAFNESPASNVVCCTPIDTEPPVITHTAVTTAVAAEQLAIDASVTDNVNVENAELHYRANGGEWKTAAMRLISGSKYRAVISAYEISEGTLEYYITAYDGTNTSSNATETEPISVTVKSEHAYGEGVVTTPATCTADGIKTFTCADCGKTKTETIPALGHKYSTEWTTDTPATCTSVGEKSHHCERCTERADITEIPMTEHNYDRGKVTTANSCTENGVMLYTCIDCGHTKEEVLPATGHKYTNTVVAPTCNAKGYSEHVCQNCGESYRDTFTAQLTHDFVETVINPATCTTDGTVRRECKDCGYFTMTVLPRTGHSYKDTVVAPTCTLQGYTEHICEKCGESYKDTYTDKAAHEYESKVVAPTCTAKGYTEHTCMNCHDTYKDSYTDQTAHDYTDTVINPATCTSDGTVKRTCKNCDYFTIEVTPRTGHSYKDTVVAPTCTSQGYTEHICENCGESYKDTYTDKTAHEFESTVVAPTCTTQGYTEHTCKNCHDSYKDTYTELVAHDYKDTIVPPTCTEKGYTEHVCQNCGETVRDTYTDKIAHDFTDTVINAATCTSDGTVKHACKHCDYFTMGVIPRTGHSYKDTVVAPTCISQGYTEHVCENCGESYKDTYTDKTAHEYESTVVAPTCESRGYTKHVCSVCGDTVIDTYTDKAAHDCTETVINAATCTTDGTVRKECRHCGYFTIETIAKTGHSFKNKVVSPTCTAQGYTEHTCEKCGQSYKDTYTPVKQHDFKIEKTDNATCTADGQTVYVCKNCGAHSVEAITKTGHSYRDTVVKPTCTAQGYTEHTCEKCGQSYRDTFTDKAAHNYKATVVNPTCASKGYTEHTCTVCGDSYKDKFTDETAHEFTETVVNKATCTSDGTVRRECRHCGFFTIETVAKTGHSYKNIVVSPTCTAQGYTEHTCEKCGQSYKDSYTDKTAHDYSAAVIAPTCTEQGYTEHTCKSCGESYRDKYTPVKQHSFEVERTDSATCTADGQTVYVCKDCGMRRYETIPRTKHTLKDIIVSPTCSEKGFTDHVCEDCGYTYRDSYTDKTEHHFDEGTVTVRPTNRSTGIKMYVCEDCGAVRTEVIPIVKESETAGDPDTSEDISTDTGTDVTTDTSIDTSTDEGTDTTLDTETDTSVDTSTDAETDTTTDTETDTATDIASDTESETDSDTSSDTGSDTDKTDTPDEPIGLLGDVDGDGDITANDALAILRQSVGLENFDENKLLLADVDGDGDITANDALEVLRYSVGLSQNEIIKTPVFRKQAP